MVIMTRNHVHVLWVLASLALILSSCKPSGPTLDEPPEGWVRDGDQWWVEDEDTSGAFRHLEDFESMGLTSGTVVYASPRMAGGGAELRREQVVFAVRRSLLPLYRNAPEIVDSLFERHVAPEIRTASLEDSQDAVVERNKKRAYASLRRHFREPAPALSLGRDVAVAYPDSLRRSGIGGAVRIQVRVNAAGEPIAMKLTDGVHPTLDQIAMHATTRMRWQPAYLLDRNDWKPVPSWARYAIHFTSAN